MGYLIFQYKETIVFKEYKTMDEVPDTTHTKVDHYSKKKLYVNKDRMKLEGLVVKKDKYNRALNRRKWEHMDEY